ncbi:MAG TPA: AhpC/TSA family protein, partial [Gallionellaceae bacterium]
MSWLKSIFITCYLMLLMGVAGYSGWMLTRGADALAWLGTLLTVAPILSTVSWLMVFKNRARTTAHFPQFNILGVAGVALSAWAWYAKGAPVLPLALAAESWIAFLVYAYWFSTFGGRDPSMKLVVGSAL